jgi:hypothetical protein
MPPVGHLFFEIGGDTSRLPIVINNLATPPFQVFLDFYLSLIVSLIVFAIEWETILIQQPYFQENDSKGRALLKVSVYTPRCLGCRISHTPGTPAQVESFGRAVHKTTTIR